jgi:hypothetical protein
MQGLSALATARPGPRVSDRGDYRGGSSVDVAGVTWWVRIGCS